MTVEFRHIVKTVNNFHKDHYCHHLHHLTALGKNQTCQYLHVARVVSRTVRLYIDCYCISHTVYGTFLMEAIASTTIMIFPFRK